MQFYLLINNKFCVLFFLFFLMFNTDVYAEVNFGSIETSEEFFIKDVNFSIFTTRYDLSLSSADILIKTSSAIFLEKEIMFLRDVFYRYLHVVEVKNIKAEHYVNNLQNYLLEDLQHIYGIELVQDVKVIVKR